MKKIREHIVFTVTLVTFFAVFVQVFLQHAAVSASQTISIDPGKAFLGYSSVIVFFIFSYVFLGDIRYDNHRLSKIVNVLLLTEMVLIALSTSYLASFDWITSISVGWPLVVLLNTILYVAIGLMPVIIFVVILIWRFSLKSKGVL